MDNQCFYCKKYISSNSRPYHQFKNERDEMWCSCSFYYTSNPPRSDYSSTMWLGSHENAAMVENTLPTTRQNWQANTFDFSMFQNTDLQIASSSAAPLDSAETEPDLSTKLVSDYQNVSATQYSGPNSTAFWTNSTSAQTEIRENVGPQLRCPYCLAAFKAPSLVTVHINVWHLESKSGPPALVPDAAAIDENQYYNRIHPFRCTLQCPGTQRIVGSSFKIHQDQYHQGGQDEYVQNPKKNRCPFRCFARLKTKELRRRHEQKCSWHKVDRKLDNDLELVMNPKKNRCPFLCFGRFMTKAHRRAHEENCAGHKAGRELESSESKLSSSKLSKSVATATEPIPVCPPSVSTYGVFPVSRHSRCEGEPEHDGYHNGYNDRGNNHSPTHTTLFNHPQSSNHHNKMVSVNKQRIEEDNDSVAVLLDFLNSQGLPVPHPDPQFEHFGGTSENNGGNLFFWQ